MIDKLKQAQTRLHSGEELYFDLLSGAKASDRMARVSPREAFIKMSFEKAFIIARVRRGKLTQSYRFAYKPAGAGQEIWDVEVLLGFSDERIFRVQMFYGRPAPF